LDGWIDSGGVYYSTPAREPQDQPNVHHGSYSMFSLRIFFRIINDFVHKFTLDRTFVDFTISLLILPFDIVEFNSKMVKSTVKP
jgi:hypothetical protein